MAATDLPLELVELLPGGAELRVAVSLELAEALRPFLASVGDALVREESSTQLLRAASASRAENQQCGVQ
jgi:hypothetical protein